MPPPYLFLCLADPPSPDGPARRLNAAGRWAVQGSARSPLLAWPATAAPAAQAAAERASAARGCVVAVRAPADADGVEEREIQRFGEAFEAALLGPTAHSAAKARRLRTEAEKLDAFCLIVRAASAAPDQQAFAQVGRAAAKALRAKFGGGSITSAFAWLAGPAGQEALESLLTGEIEPTGALSIAQIAEAARLAREAEQLREPR
ncbi:hypothetical protein QTI33_30405 [Variovorax sp. J22P271]|uniref:hypothetical protein n=1 Tax=Variovorax davisae TaxID=3053515 RepID=UPI002579087A|nr:hypothetical protein [Variovorax sp. J22P271]MDM0036480.1 hypothetical protein [Variovorax sp. J22P271]